MNKLLVLSVSLACVSMLQAEEKSFAQRLKEAVEGYSRTAQQFPDYSQPARAGSQATERASKGVEETKTGLTDAWEKLKEWWQSATGPAVGKKITTTEQTVEKRVAPNLPAAEKTTQKQ
jgi:hypothetical protein